MSVPLMKYWSISSIILTEEAKELGLEVEIISKDKNLFYIKGEGKEILFKSTDFGGNSSLGLKIANDKELTYKILEKYNLPIAKTWYISHEEIDNVEKLSIVFPVIIKPLEEGHGNGVMMNILNISELKSKLEESFKVYNKMIIQKQIEGDEYRILVVKGEVIKSGRRVPAKVKGNGILSIKKLIEKENKNNILRGDGYKFPLSFISIDKELIEYINKQELELNSVINNGRVLFLRGNSNVSTGGIPENVSNVISEDIKNIACLCAQKIGLDIAGIDIITTDITKKLSHTKGIILEINATPGLGGDKELSLINTGKIILEKLFFNK